MDLITGSRPVTVVCAAFKKKQQMKVADSALPSAAAFCVSIVKNVFWSTIVIYKQSMPDRADIGEHSGVATIVACA